MERETEEPALRLRGHVGGRDGRLHLTGQGHDADAAGALGDEHVTFRQKRDRPWHVEAGGDDRRLNRRGAVRTVPVVDELAGFVGRRIVARRREQKKKCPGARLHTPLPSTKRSIASSRSPSNQPPGACTDRYFAASKRVSKIFCGESDRASKITAPSTARTVAPAKPSDSMTIAECPRTLGTF